MSQTYSPFYHAMTVEAFFGKELMKLSSDFLSYRNFAEAAGNISWQMKGLHVDPEFEKILTRVGFEFDLGETPEEFPRIFISFTKDGEIVDVIGMLTKVLIGLGHDFPQHSDEKQIDVTNHPLLYFATSKSIFDDWKVKNPFELAHEFLRTKRGVYMSHCGETHTLKLSKIAPRGIPTPPSYQQTVEQHPSQQVVPQPYQPVVPQPYQPVLAWIPSIQQWVLI